MALAVLLTSAAQAADAVPVRPHLLTAQFTTTDGRQLYESICQGCHMPGGVGAASALGGYPALAQDRHLAAKAFAIGRVLHGSKAMPPFRELLSDEQIASVVGYVRTHFGNGFKGAVSAADVKALR